MSEAEKFANRQKLFDALAEMRSKAAKEGLLIEVVHKFDRYSISADVLTDTSEIRIVDPLTGGIAKYGPSASRMSASATAKESDFARANNVDFWILRGLLVESNKDFIQNPNWRLLGGKTPPSKITVWDSKRAVSMDFSASIAFSDGYGYLCENDIIEEERLIYSWWMIKKLGNFYTVEI